MGIVVWNKKQRVTGLGRARSIARHLRSEHRLALQEKDEDEGHQEVME